MAITYTDIHHAERPSVFSRFFAAVGQAYVAYANSRSRLPQIRALEAKSDEELAAMGVKRDEIARYVFRDVFYV
jgi:uncharacterized protein YjiS (DUF1127 family)